MPKSQLHKLSVQKINNLPYKNKDYKVGDGGGLYIHIRRHKRKEWLFRYTSPITGKRISTNLGAYPDTSLPNARQIAANNRAMLALNLDPKIEADKMRKETEQRHRENQKLNRNTIENIFTEWKNAKLKNRKDKGEDIERAFRKDVFPVIGTTPIHDITRQDITDVLAKPLARNSNRMANRLLSDLKQFMGYALDEEYIEKDPTARMTKSRVGGSEIRRDRVLLKEERALLVEIMPKSDLAPKYQSAIFLLLLTGCRIRELAHTRWADVSFEERTLVIPAANAKNKKEHTVYLSDLAIEHFEALYAQRTNNEWVFASFRGHEPINKQTITKAVTDRQKDKPINGRTANNGSLILPNGQWTPHDLRRTAATIMQELGVFPHIIKKCLNQTVDDPIIQTYQRAELIKDQQDAFDLLGAYWENIVTKAPSQINERGFERIRITAIP